MGKSSKVKKKLRRKLSLTKRQFIEQLCTGCRICGTDTDASYCFDFPYASDPRIFVTAIYPKLISLRGWNLGNIDPANEYEYTDLDAIKFSRIFCVSEACIPAYDRKGECYQESECMAVFRKMVIDSNPSGITDKFKCKRSYKPRKVVEPYPTFITNDNPEFIERIRKILTVAA